MAQVGENHRVTLIRSLAPNPRAGPAGKWKEKEKELP